MYSAYLPYIFLIAALAVAVLQHRRNRELKLDEKIRYYAGIAILLFYSLLLWYLEGFPLSEFIFIFAVALLSFNLIYEYVKHKLDFLLSFVITATASILAALYIGILPLIQVFAIGSLIGAMMRWGYVHVQDKSDKRLERRRDIFQIVIGAIVIAVMLLFTSTDAYYIVFALILAGYFIGNIMTSNRYHSKFLESFERKGTVFGVGAVYMAIGALLIFGLLGSRSALTLSVPYINGMLQVPLYNFIIVMLEALLICDALATIVGIRGKRRFPLNKSKSWEGFAAYAVSLALLGFPFIGFYSVLFGVVLALVESMSDRIDDNIAIPVAAIILLYIIFMFV